MGNLEKEEMVATGKVIKKLEQQAKHFRKLLPEGNPDIVRRLNDLMFWIFVCRTVLQNLASAASNRSQTSAIQAEDVKKLIDATSRMKEAGRASGRATKAEQELATAVATHLKSLLSVPRFDQAVALTVWTSHRKTLGRLSGAKDLAGLRAAVAEALKEGLKVGVEKAFGLEFFSAIWSVMDKFGKTKKTAKAGSDFLDFIQALTFGYARWALEAQCQVHRLKSELQSLTEAQLRSVASKELLKIFGDTSSTAG